MSRIVYVNGAYVPEEEAKISVFDRGFLFADGVYEVTSVLDGKLIDYPGHRARLHRSLGELDLTLPVEDAELEAIHRELLTRNKMFEGMVYLQVTRGAADRDFAYPVGATPSLVMFTQAVALVDSPKARDGIKVIGVPDIRWARRDIKTVMLLAPVLGKQAAHEAGAFEAWMIEDGMVTEGTSSNAYIVKDGKVTTRGLSNRILAGCTRRSLFRLAREHGVELEERAFSAGEAYGADEAFLTSASNFVLPITEIDGRRIGGGQPGPVTRKLREIFLQVAMGQAPR